MYICAAKNNNITIWRGRKVPSFYKLKMMFEKVARLVKEILDKNESLFLVDLTVSGNNKINIVIDGDKDVSLNDCITISRYVEHLLDREKEDFSIEVSSPGATAPIKNKRQFKKNIGRDLKLVLTNGEKIEGTLKDADDKKLTLTWKTREPKPLGKGKRTVVKTLEKLYSDIEEAKVIVKFN